MDQIRQRLQRHMALYGYQIVDVPILQPADLFLIKAGDQIANRLFTFDQNGQQWALRPEFTAAAAYYYDGVEEGAREVARWQFCGPVFEDDPNAKDSQNQRYSIGAELIGLDGALADAEIMAMAMRGLDQLSTGQAHLTIGHTAFVRRLLQRFDLDVRTLRFLLHHLAALHDAALGQDFVLEQFDRFVAARNTSATQPETDVFLQMDESQTRSDSQQR
ncbi:MAG: ATP phosphoribosyltransferase regulatory subunit, partial [Anaerolineae bacterium]|nr:ATP phosphoribosyltransferase regulatory subunit [Anaerolineae bacterium]